VGMNAHVVHRDKGVFGEDADLFRPERWLESEARNKEMEKYLLTFGAGSRTCVGKNISLMVRLSNPRFNSPSPDVHFSRIAVLGMWLMAGN